MNDLPKFASPDDALRGANERGELEAARRAGVLAYKMLDHWLRALDLIDELRAVDTQRDDILRELAPFLGLDGRDDWRGLRNTPTDDLARTGAGSAVVELAMARDPARCSSPTRAAQLVEPLNRDWGFSAGAWLKNTNHRRRQARREHPCSQGSQEDV